jgi:uncharacterized membrane protein YdbT with pleckstrin-like domain
VPFPRRLLNEGEDVVLDLHPHWWFFSGPVAAVVAATVAAVAVREVSDELSLVLLAVAGLALLWVAGRYARWATTNFVVTTDRLVFREGVLGKRGKEIPLERVNDIAVTQTLFERIIGAGDVTIESGGERGQQVFTDIRKPFLVQNVIYTEMERAGERDAARAAGQPVLSIPEQIEKLDELRRRGVITQAEFDVKKTQLLERM